MQLTFLGADHEVTGSCHFLQACGKNILLDCGMEQGQDVYENQEIPVPATDVDYVLLSHAHIDHSGLLPLLYQRGFKGQIVATEATTQLCNIMLRDSAHIQEFEAEWRNRKGRRAGKAEIPPLYTTADAEGAIGLFVPHPYDKQFELCEGISVRFKDVGHLLGSASIEIWCTEGDVTKKIVYSGDIGNIDQPIIKDPNYVTEGDVVIMESTYGDRTHGERPDYITHLTEIIQKTFDKGGNVVIPSFAVGRTQEMLYFLREIKDKKLIKNHDNFEVYVDSPLAIEATNVFNRNVQDCFDEEAMALIKEGINPISFPGLKTSVSSEESKQINFESRPKVIISASGMCEAGRIRHHLKHNLWRRESTILFVGYQANGTLGRSLIEGATTVKLFGESIEVMANIQQLAGISGHADQAGLINWLEAIKDKKPEQVFVVHGEDSVCDAFAQRLKDDYGYQAIAPYSGAVYDLISGECVKEGAMVRVTKKPAEKRATDVFMRLMQAGKRLLSVISSNEGGANKDLSKFTNEINNLCEKWER